MKKKVKKIPKFAIGGLAGSSYNKTLPTKIENFLRLQTDTPLLSTQDGAGFNLSGIATGSNELLMNTFGIEDNSTAGVMLNSAAQGSDIGGSIVPGWGHLIGAVAGGTLGAFKKGSVDPNTGEIQYGGIFGRSGASLRRESNRIKGSILAKARTEDLQANWMNQGINPAPNALAAEGGIVPGEHYASRGEVEVAADGTNAVRYGWDPKGKDTYHVYTNPDGSSAVGNLVFTEEGVKRPNGEKYSDAAEKIIKGTKEGSKLRLISLKKLANEMEEQKMGKEIKKIKNGIPAHEGGENPYAPSNMGNNTWWTYIKKLADQFGESVEQFLNRAKLRGEDLSKFGSTGLIPYVNPTTGTVSFALPWVSNYIDGSTRADDVITNEKVVTPVVRDGQTVVVPLDDKKGIKKASNTKVAANKELSVVNKQSEPKNEKATPEQFAENLKSVLNDDIGERHWLRGPIETKSLARVAFENAPKPIAPPFTVLRPEQDADVNYSNPSWQDWLYRTALLTQPLWDRAKAEPVQYEIPNAKYVPTGVDVSSQLRDVSEGYALSRYNFANLYPNTGAGMAAGLQAASTAAKQRADIHQYKTDAQNKLIGANVGIYNNWANRRAEILNDMYNKAAANRASARNINRQNRAAALSNYGQMLRDDKQYAMDTLKLDALTPLIMYGTENSDTLIKKARQILNK